ncbi:hypothetical protein V6N13_094468 [Hibiscus sabdariffa]
MICFPCGIYGHNPEICPAQKLSTDDFMTVEHVQSVQPLCHETDSYGPWMVVERRQRRTPVKQVPPKVNQATSNVVASRFNPISEENLSEHTTSTDVPPRSHVSVVAAKGKGVAPHTIRTKKTKSAHARLDRFICNTYWDEAFPESSVSHLLRMCSDHRHVLLQVGHLPSGSPKPPFRYFTGSLSETIRSSTVATKDWNNNIFGHIGTRKRILQVRLRGVQRVLCTRNSSFLSNLENELLLELESLLDQEEMLWRQKSCSDWIHLGDRNTSYFHRKAKIRKHRNRITCLQLRDGSWCDDEGALKEEAVRYYKSLFSMDVAYHGPLPNFNLFPTIDSTVLSTLESVPSSEEIHEALRDMAPLKALGLDGLQAEFFQKKTGISLVLRSCSSLWRLLALFWDEFRSHVSWCLCDGSRVDVWADTWVPELGCLRDHVRYPSFPLLYPTFEDLMTTSRAWNVPLLLHIFPPTVAHHIFSIRCPEPNDREDFCRWRWGPDFSIKDAYERKSRNEYVFSGFSQRPDAIAHHSIIWARHYVEAESKRQHLTMQSNVPHPVQWNPAPSRWISLNTDGTVCPSSRYARIGGLFRDSSGSCLHGFGRSVGITDAFSTELWAIYEGLLLAWKMGFEFVQVQSDCSKVISALKANDETIVLSLSSGVLLDYVNEVGWLILFGFLGKQIMLLIILSKGFLCLNLSWFTLIAPLQILRRYSCVILTVLHIVGALLISFYL